MNLVCKFIDFIDFLAILDLNPKVDWPYQINKVGNLVLKEKKTLAQVKNSRIILILRCQFVD